MPRTPKQKAEPENKVDDRSEDSWSEDQTTRGYYYDDAYGYETFVEDDEENTEQETVKGEN